MVPALVNLALIIFALRWLGKEEYGRYSLIFYVLMLLSTFSYGWIQQSILRYFSMYNSYRGVATMRFGVLTLLSSVAGALIFLFLGPFYYKISIGETLLLVVIIILYNFLALSMTISQAGFKPFLYALREGSYNLLMIIGFAVLVLLFGQKTYTSLFLAMFIGLLGTVVIPFLLRFRQKLSWRWSPAYFNALFFKKMWSFGILLSIWLSVSYLFNIANRFFIKEYSGYADVGLFSSVNDLIFKISGFVCMPVLLVYHPRITALWNDGKRKEALREIKLALSLEVLVFAGIIIVFLPSMTFLYDKVLKINEGNLFWMSLMLIVSAFLWQAALLVHKPLELLFRLKEMIISIVIALIVNVTGNIFLIPIYGYRAAAVATLGGVFTYIVLVAIQSGYFLKKEGRL
jgi:O-antigen/teichoic acid export membrane protein